MAEDFIMRENNFKKIYFAFLIFISFTACSTNDGREPSTAEWTFMVYLDADNDLSPYASGDLSEMMAIGSTEKVNIIVQHDGYQSPAFRYKVEKGWLNTITELGEPNMASAATISEFIDFSVKNYPAKKYAFILWDHGQGWKSILSDWDNNGYRSAPLNNHIVAEGIKDSGLFIDVLGVDACAMATIEAAYEFSSTASFMVSSQELVKIKGWDYYDLLARLNANPGMTPEELSIEAVESFRSQAESSGLHEQTLSAINLTYISDVVEAVNSLAGFLYETISDPEIQAQMRDARDNVQEFDPIIDANTYVDLYDLGILLEGEKSNVAKAVGNAVISEYHGSERPNANGLSIAFFNVPKIYDQSKFLSLSLYDPDYINLEKKRENPVAFLDETIWGNLLDAFYSAQYPEIYTEMKTWKYYQRL